jgi:hypothetical protein
VALTCTTSTFTVLVILMDRLAGNVQHKARRKNTPKNRGSAPQITPISDEPLARSRSPASIKEDVDRRRWSDFPEDNVFTGWRKWEMFWREIFLFFCHLLPVTCHLLFIVVVFSSQGLRCRSPCSPARPPQGVGVESIYRFEG